MYDQSVALSIEPEIRRFLRRVRWGRFVGASAQALVVLAVAAAALLITLRLLGHAPTPSPWWALALVIPPVFGVLAVRRLGFSHRLGAAHLDRRLGMDGLLVTALERDAAAYAPEIRERLADVRTALPRLRLGRPAARLGLTALVIFVLLLLPPLAPAPAAAPPIVAESLETYEAKLDALEERGALKAERKESFEERIESLKSKVKEGEQVAWKDLDAIQEALAHEEALEGARLEHARQDLAAFARGDDEATARGRSAAAERMAALLADAKAAGLLDKLPPDMAAKLGQMASKNDAAGLAEAYDETALRQLAAALAQTADDKLGGLPQGALPQGGALPSLQELMQGTDMKGVFGEPCGLCKGSGKQKNGKGEEPCPG